MVNTIIGYVAFLSLMLIFVAQLLCNGGSKYHLEIFTKTVVSFPFLSLEQDQVCFLFQHSRLGGAAHPSKPLLLIFLMNDNYLVTSY